MLVRLKAMQLEDHLVFLVSEVPPFEVSPQVANPSEFAALAAVEKPFSFGERLPTAFPMTSDVCNQRIIFFFSSRSLVCVGFITAGRPSHPLY
ncbi:hypothetical protein Scep_007018 [Stephania cephalantha]|uniref:Uncharacterized protein n=1 Tax=Stephania cephalantha TaxID=152367 RepID=A0AAP0K995_9MAGN